MNTLNKKAFTLVELLSVVVLLGVISIIIVPNITNILISSKDELYNNQVEVIKVAAKLWASNEENKLFLINNEQWPYIITLGDLQEGSYIDENIKNPINDEFFSDSTLIYINYEDNQYTYEIDENTVDGQSQIITLLGDRSYNLEVKNAYVEPGVSAKDLNDNDISSNIETNFYKNGLPIDNIDTNTLSNYTIKYSVSYMDNDGNTKSSVAFRRVNIVDTTAPVIVCSECTDNMVQIESTNSYVLPEVTATDNYDESVSILKIGSFSTIIPGKRKIVYLATDSSGNSSNLEINFDIQDTIAPTIIDVKQVDVLDNYVIYVVEATDSGSGIKEYSIDGGLTWQKSNQFNVPIVGSLRNVIVKDNAGNTSSWQKKDYYVKEFDYVNDKQLFITPATGYYKVELWGAQGGSATYTTLYKGGNGAYSSGIIYLEKNEKLYIYVGGMGQSVAGTSTFTMTENGNGYNGGGVGTAVADNSTGGGGGGATDIRYFGSNDPSTSDLLWDSELGLKSRIMVAAGGGGAKSHNSTPSYSGIGGAGGTLIGLNAVQGNTTCYAYGVGGTQISGGIATPCPTDGHDYTDVASFGKGASSYTEFTYNDGAHSGGGGGYYGGGAGYHAAAGGGSSFISGYAGVNAITSNTSFTPTNNTIHYSGKYFIDGQMNDGINEGNGKAKITFIGETGPERVNTKLNNVRYIKDCINGNTMGQKNAWNEIQAIVDGINVALNKDVTSTGTINLNDNTSYSFASIVDGDIVNSKSNAYINETGLQCVTIDLGRIYNLDEIAVWHYWEDGRTYYDNVTYVSNDNENWIEVIRNSKPETSNGKRVNFKDNKTSYSHQVTNLIVNSNFASTSNWSQKSTSVTNTIAGTITNNSLYLNDTSTTAGYWSYQFINFIEGHKYYMAIDMSISAISGNLTYAIGNGTAVTTNLRTNAITNGYKNLSKITTALAGDKYIQIGISLAHTCTAYLKNLQLIDLTETFGAGNEPSQAWCDENIPYFEGTKTLYFDD